MHIKEISEEEILLTLFPYTMVSSELFFKLIPGILTDSQAAKNFGKRIHTLLKGGKLSATRLADGSRQWQLTEIGRSCVASGLYLQGNQSHVSRDPAGAI